MVCQICGAKSGFYPLCRDHYQDYMRGEVVKCPDCGKYRPKDDDCSECKEHVAGDQIKIKVKEIEAWGKRLYAIAKKGQEWGGTGHDLFRYKKALGISKRMKQHWEGAEKETVSIEKKTLQGWTTALKSIAVDGIERSDDTYDITRYSDIREIADEISEESASYSSVIEDEPEESSEPSNITFVADTEIAPTLLGMIERAERRILIASPWIKGVKDILEKLAEAQEKRGVLVKVLVRKSEGTRKGWNEDLRSLHKKHIHVEAADFLHAKMILVDNSELYIGSANLLESSMDRNREAGIVTSDTETLEKAARYFNDLFLEAFEKRA